MTTYFFLQYHLPSAFVLYYLIFNILSTAQQKYYMRKRAGDSLPGSGGDSGSKRPPVLMYGPSGGSAIPISGRNGNANGNGNSNGNNSNGSRRVPVGSLSDAPSNERSGVQSNGAAPTAKGIIAPPKVHPKKKRR